MTPTQPPEIQEVEPDLFVARDDLYPGGTKARYLGRFYEETGCAEAVYASPSEGGAQFALPTVAKALGRAAHVFVAARKHPHARTLEARRFGARITLVRPGYLSVVQSRARRYAANTPGAALLPFGADLPYAAEAVAEAARKLDIRPVEVWCAGGSGTLSRGLQAAFPEAHHNVVQIGKRVLLPGATVHVHHLAFAETEIQPQFFPSDAHYDAKAFSYCRKRRGDGPVLFWNVAGPPRL